MCLQNVGRFIKIQVESPESDLYPTMWIWFELENCDDVFQCPVEWDAVVEIREIDGT